MSRSFKNSFVYCIDKLDIINHKSIKMKKILCLVYEYPCDCQKRNQRLEVAHDTIV